tara:strand:+ start:338 stop:667 length:330 start_codon:yes stop_codon:yes gene_type:complete
METDMQILIVLLPITLIFYFFALSQSTLNALEKQRIDSFFNKNLLISACDSFFRANICVVTLFILAKYGQGNEIYCWAVGIMGIIWILLPLIELAFEDLEKTKEEMEEE